MWHGKHMSCKSCRSPAYSHTFGLQVVLLSGFTLIRPNIPPWYIGEDPSELLQMILPGQPVIAWRPVDARAAIARPVQVSGSKLVLWSLP